MLFRSHQNPKTPLNRNIQINYLNSNYKFIIFLTILSLNKNNSNIFYQILLLFILSWKFIIGSIITPVDNTATTTAATITTASISPGISIIPDYIIIIIIFIINFTITFSGRVGFLRWGRNYPIP